MSLPSKHSLNLSPSHHLHWQHLGPTTPIFAKNISISFKLVYTFVPLQFIFNVSVSIVVYKNKGIHVTLVLKKKKTNYEFINLFKVKVKVCAVVSISFTSRPFITYRSLPSTTPSSFISVSTSQTFSMFLKNSSPGPASDTLDLSAPQCEHYSPDVYKIHTLLSSISFYQMALSGISAHPHQSILNFTFPSHQQSPSFLFCSDPALFPQT